MNLQISEGSGPIKGTPKHFWYEDNLKVKAYEEVTIIYGAGDSFTAKVERLG